MAEPIHILVTGGAGQIGLEMARAEWPVDVLLHMPTRSELDLGDIASVAPAFAARPYAAVVNLGAYTSVDLAESQVAAAFAANAMGPAILADVTSAAGVPLIHISTDYVFDGGKVDPYVETDCGRPLGVYGASKLAGELAVLSGNPRSIVLRTAWVVSRHRTNFLKTILRLNAERSALRVVGDQFGCPTSATDVAAALRQMVLRMIADEQAPLGIYHFVNSGTTSWAGLAETILTFHSANDAPKATVEAITSAEYPTKSRRPANSCLSTDKIASDYDIHPRPWRDAVAEIIAEMNAERTEV